MRVTVYAIAQLRFTDRAAYDRYQARFMEVFRRHPGTLLAADESPEVVEGDWDREKLVLMSFPDEAAFRGLGAIAGISGDLEGPSGGRRHAGAAACRGCNDRAPVDRTRRAGLGDRAQAGDRPGRPDGAVPAGRDRGRAQVPAGGPNVLRAFTYPFDDVKVLIVGQDPYPTPGHAVGLSFSVAPDVRPLPRSLANIFDEYAADLGHPQPSCGDLTPWAERGVMLLNRVLTVRPSNPASHRGKGWEAVTECAIRALADAVAAAGGHPVGPRRVNAQTHSGRR